MPAEQPKSVRLVEYLIKLASLGTQRVREVSRYESVLWLSQIPSNNDCFTQVWGQADDRENDIWIEVKYRREPSVPQPPAQCKNWGFASELTDKKNAPELAPQSFSASNSHPLFEDCRDSANIEKLEKLEDYPAVRELWARYLEQKWHPWKSAHDEWQQVHDVYSTIFAMHQSQIRLAEEFELVLGLGLLTWETPTGQRVHRHLMVADALIEFEMSQGLFRVRPHTDGARLRIELDMLEPDDLLPDAETQATVALEAGHWDPWDKSSVQNALKAIGHSLAQGAFEYSDSAATDSRQATSNPVVEWAPALILRKRTTRGLVSALRGIKDRLERGEPIPPAFADLAETGERTNADSDQCLYHEFSDHADGEVYFPKPSNFEQRAIIEKMSNAQGILVQGPPGTGKSHTIANLICHLLATGRRILITSKTPRALKVLEDLLPEDLQPLCINLLGSGPDERRSLETSVGGILRRLDNWNTADAETLSKDLAARIQSLRQEKSSLERQLRTIRESETYEHTIADGAYTGTAARIAQATQRDRSMYEWFEDTVPLDQGCWFSDVALLDILAGLRATTQIERSELSLVWPELSLTADAFDDLVRKERKAEELENVFARDADVKRARILASRPPEHTKALFDSLRFLHQERERLQAVSQPWLARCINDVAVGQAATWRELQKITEEAIAKIEPLLGVADHPVLEYSGPSSPRILLEAARNVHKHLSKGGRLGLWPFQSRELRESLHVLKWATVNGRRSRTKEQFKQLAILLEVQLDLERTWEAWAGLSERSQGQIISQLRSLKHLCSHLQAALCLDTSIQSCRDLLRVYDSAVPEPMWCDDAKIWELASACRLALAIASKRKVTAAIENVETEIARAAEATNAHPVTLELLKAVQNRNAAQFSHQLQVVTSLKGRRERLITLDLNLDKLRDSLPLLSRSLEATFTDSAWETRLPTIAQAWQWAQAKDWLDNYICKEDALSIAIRVRQVEDEIHASIAKLASLHAWNICNARLTDSHRSRMEAWQQAMDRFGTGTGKYASKHRADAQTHLNACRDAIPAWVMPLHRIWDTIAPLPGMFDVIIVDEASQCGPESLPIFYLAKQVVIVGDNKQISPEAVGIDRSTVHGLMNRYLHDFQFKDSFGVESSLFDHSKLRYGTRRITLREHFRCMPEIIRFSNEMFYNDTPLIPLRQYGPDRLPPLERVFVAGGYREGQNNDVQNAPEAEAVADRVTEICNDPRYDGKSIGVVVLQGEAQGKRIEKLLLKRLGAAEFERRRIVCGNPYSFQGDERHVILLSLVAACNARIGALTHPADERRFNVAASRARDSMILFHSVKKEDLSPKCLRRRLLDFFENSRPQTVAGIAKEELELHAFRDNRDIINAPPPFESWFEVDVALELLRRGFSVIPQYEVASRRIDLVVEGGHARLAVECDGDYWHGVDRYEEDMQRQRQLERCGWEFYRIAESSFYTNKERAMAELWPALEQRNIRPIRFYDSCPPVNEAPEAPPDSNHTSTQPSVTNATSTRSASPSRQPNSERHTGRRATQVSAMEIQEAILEVLSNRPNQSCKLESIGSYVLRHLAIRTRGKPREQFERRVMRCIAKLSRDMRIEHYKAKNPRIRLSSQDDC